MSSKGLACPQLEIIHTAKWHILETPSWTTWKAPRRGGALTVQPSNSSLKHVSKEYRNARPTRDVDVNARSSFSVIAPNWNNAEVHEQMKELQHIHIRYWAVFLHIKKEQTTDTHNPMAESPNHHAGK